MTVPHNRIATALAVLVVLGAGYYLIFGLRVGARNRPVTHTLISPNGTNTFVVTERVEESIGQSVVRFTLIHEGKRIVDGDAILVDSPRPSLLTQFDKKEWVSESTLRLAASNPPEWPMPGKVSISNETDKDITYLRIMARDMFLVTGVAPRSRLTLETAAISRQSGALSYIAAKGRFADGNEIREEGASFNIDNAYANPAHYSIVITDSRVTISSNEFKRR